MTVKKINANAVILWNMYGFVTAKISEGKTVKEGIEDFIATFKYEGNKLSLTRLYYNLNKENTQNRKGE